MTSGKLIQLGRYKIIEPVGTGNYAVVYKAQDELLDRVVALKVLKDEVSSDDQLVKRFTREARAMANLIHAHIALVLDMGQIDGKFFLAMRFVEGIPLDQVILQRGKLPWAEAMKIIGEIGDALDYAHAHGIIHRDVKPKNIIISQKEGSVLTDFGFVKAVNDASFLTNTDAIIGTPQYIPPEIWRNEPAGPASDQYSLACVFIEMVEGRQLFDGKRLDVIMRQHLNSTDVWDTWSSGIPGGAEAVLRKALAQRPADRFPDIKSFVTCLSRCVETDKTTVQARPTNLFGPKDIKETLIPDSPSQPVTPLDLAAPSTRDIHTSSEKSESTRQKVPTEPVKEGFFKRLQRAVTPDKPILGLLLPSNEIFPLGYEDGKTLIGRGESCDLIIESLGVSRQHALITVSNGVVTIEDLGSRNGTLVNNKRVTKPVKITGGEKISLGKNITLEVVIVK